MAWVGLISTSRLPGRNSPEPARTLAQGLGARSLRLKLAARQHEDVKKGGIRIPLRVLERLICLPLNVVSIFVLSYVAFTANSGYLFYGLDGRFEVSLITQNSLFVPLLFSFTNDFIHGLGNIWFPVNAHLIPAYILSLSGPGILTNLPLVYAICATELFVATYFAGRIIDVDRNVALIAGWALVLLVFQYVGWNRIPSTFRAFPHYATIAAIGTLIAASLLRLQIAFPARSVILAFAIFGGLTYVVLAAPTVLILTTLPIVMFGIGSLCAASGWRDLLFKMSVMGAVLAACVGFGYAHFIAGLATYTAADTFRELSLRAPELQYVSMLFWSPPTGWLTGFLTVERTFVGLGLLGGLFAAWQCRGRTRVAAIAFLSTALLYLAIALLYVYGVLYGPRPTLWYFENFLLPYHALFVIFLVAEVAERLLNLATRFTDHWRLRWPRVSAAALTMCIPIIPWGWVSWERAHALPPDLPYFAAHPQAETPITRILKQEASLVPGSEFRGRVATMTGRIFPENMDVSFLTVAGEPDTLAMVATGNSHQAAGLWQDSIPTLLEYSQLLTPPYFAFTRRFFTEPGDAQMRNLVAMRRIDPPLLAALGVRFVITDKPFDGLHLRQVLDVPVSQDFLVRTGIREPIADFKMYLYELNKPNLGQYAPVEVRTASTGSAMLAKLGDPSVDLSRTLITADEVPQQLAAAELQGFRVGQGEFRVQAASNGHSVLVLPMEFSRCLRVLTNTSDAGEVRLFRADLMLTGVLFYKSIDATIVYRNGPFTNPTCRLHDAADMTAIEMSNAFKDHPEFIAETTPNQ